MNWKVYYLVFVALLVTSYSNSQSNLLNAIEVDQIGKQSKEKIAADNDTPLSYGYIDDRDILWSKVVWEFVDLNQKINLPYYYPIDTANISNDRRSLFDTLLKGIRKGDIKNVYSDSFFTSKITGSEINEKLVNIRLNGDYPDTFRIQTQDIEGYMMKGMWYFDKRLGELKYRLLALCPVTPEARDAGNEKADVIDLFWVYFPTVRDILHESKAFNDKNSAMPITFDHLLNSRRFNGQIYKEENVYGDREIQQYMKDNSQNQLLESERVKEKIRDFESDMWNY